MTDNDVIHKEIHQALHEGDLITVNMLLKDQDVDVDFRDVTHDLQTLLMKLCYVNMDITSLKLIIETIFEKSPDVNIQDSWGRTVLMHACIANRPLIIESLLEFDQTDVGLTDFDGNSALSFAVQNCDVFTLEDILQHPSGARLLTVHNSKGQTPVTIAEKSGDKSVTRLFQSYVDKTVGLQQKKKNRNHRHRDVIKLRSSTKPRRSTERQSVSSAPPESSSKNKDDHKLLGRPTLDITVATSQSYEAHAHEKCDSAPVHRSNPNTFDDKTHSAVTSLSLSSPRLQRRHHKQNSLLEDCFKRNNVNLLPPMHATSGGSGIDLTDRDLLLPEHSIRRQRRPSISLPDLRSVTGFLVTSGSSTPRSDVGDDAEESSCHIPTALKTINDEVGNDDYVFNNTFSTARNRLHKTSSKQSLCDVSLPDIHKGVTKRNELNYGKKGFQPLNRQRKFSSSDDQIQRTLAVNDSG